MISATALTLWVLPSAVGSSSFASAWTIPSGTINLVHGDGSIGEALVLNRDVSVVLFTGSYDVGHRIQKLSADFFDRIVAAEMGSKSAVIVCADAVNPPGPVHEYVFIPAAALQVVVEPAHTALLPPVIVQFRGGI